MSRHRVITTTGGSLISAILVVVAGVGAPLAEDACDRAVRAAQSGDLKAAHAAATQCHKLQPRDGKARSLLAEIESQLGLSLASQERFQEAAARFRALIGLRPDFAAGHYNLGLCLMNLGDEPGAEEAFRNTLTLSPSHAKAESALAQVILAIARNQPARMKEARDALLAAVKTAPADADLRFNLAFTLSRLADDEGAAEQYSETLRLRPDYPGGESSLAYTLYRLSNWKDAATHFRAALAHNQSDFALYYYFGSTLLKMGEVAEASDMLERASRLDPEHPGVHFQLASLFRSKGDAERAARELKLFRELSAKQEAIRLSEGLETAAKGALERGDLAGGIQALTLAFENQPSAGTARNLGLAYLQSGDTVQARRMLEKAMELSPREAVTHNYVGMIEARDGDAKKARQYFETAIALDPALIEARYNAGVAALGMGDTAAAVRHFETALRQSDRSRVRAALAVALSSAGRYREAQEHFDAAQPQR